MKQKMFLLHWAVICMLLVITSGCAMKRVAGDIPLSTVPEGTFVEPPSEFKPIFQPIMFDFDKSDIRSDMMPQIDKIAEWMKNHPKILLRIEGNCDERGSDEYNLALGERRSLSVRKSLADQGVDPNRMTTISYGEERPVNPAHTEMAWAENRRCEFKLSQ